MIICMIWRNVSLLYIKKEYAMNKKKGTFIIKVDNTEDNSWKGKVTWADEEVTETFRSPLELIKHIDEALNADSENG